MHFSYCCLYSVFTIGFLLISDLSVRMATPLKRLTALFFSEAFSHSNVRFNGVNTVISHNDSKQKPSKFTQCPHVHVDQRRTMSFGGLHAVFFKRCLCPSRNGGRWRFRRICHLYTCPIFTGTAKCSGYLQKWREEVWTKNSK